MRLRIVLPKVNLAVMTVPTRCAYAGCDGRKFHLRREVAKPLRDTVYHEVQVHRYQCLKCKRMLRVYPEGTTHAQTSQRVKGLAVMLYLLGFGYGATLEALGVYLASLMRCKGRPSACLGSSEIRCLHDFSFPQQFFRIMHEL